MTALTFEEVDVEGITPDAGPETENDAHYCKEPGCTNETFRNGSRGRWPNYCADHKKGAPAKKATPRSAPAQAKAAAAVLGGMNDLMTSLMFGVSMVPALPISLTNTASALAAKNEAFVEQAEAALSQDPALCRAILKAGGTSGKMALAMAYAMLGASLVPAVKADMAMTKAAQVEVEGDEA